VRGKCSVQKTDAKKQDLADDGQTDGRTNIKENHLGLQFLPFSLFRRLQNAACASRCRGVAWTERWHRVDDEMGGFGPQPGAALEGE
ncbi:hypothetical protein ABVT39_001703, partial [Epinephelus coioides]